MAKNVSIWITNWTDTGSKTPTPKYTVDIRLEWTDEDDSPRNHEGTYTFPNVLADIPLSRLRAYMEDIILQEAKIQLGIISTE